MKGLKNMFKNIANYSAENLESVVIGDNKFRTIPAFHPRAFSASSFGKGPSYNHVIATNILAAYEHFGEKPTFVPEEVGNALEDLKYNNHTAVKRPEKYISTGEEFDLLLAAGLQKYSEDFIMHAHPAHMQRALDVAKKKGYSGVPFLEEGVTWPQEDPQLWVRSPALWIPREIITRVHHNHKSWT